MILEVLLCSSVYTVRLLARLQDFLNVIRGAAKLVDRLSAANTVLIVSM
jgi:hypothetical protein